MDSFVLAGPGVTTSVGSLLSWPGFPLACGKQKLDRRSGGLSCYLAVPGL